MYISFIKLSPNIIRNRKLLKYNHELLFFSMKHCNNRCTARLWRKKWLTLKLLNIKPNGNKRVGATTYLTWHASCKRIRPSHTYIPQAMFSSYCQVKLKGSFEKRSCERGAFLFIWTCIEIARLSEWNHNCKGGKKENMPHFKNRKEKEHCLIELFHFHSSIATF